MEILLWPTSFLINAWILPNFQIINDKTVFQDEQNFGNAMNLWRMTYSPCYSDIRMIFSLFEYWMIIYIYICILYISYEQVVIVYNWCATFKKKTNASSIFFIYCRRPSTTTSRGRTIASAWCSTRSSRFRLEICVSLKENTAMEFEFIERVLHFNPRF